VVEKLPVTLRRVLLAEAVDLTLLASLFQAEIFAAAHVCFFAREMPMAVPVIVTLTLSVLSG
jgi:hypothetical protein